MGYFGKEIKMLSEKMLNELNDQINAELHSAYLYLAMSAYFEDLNLKGMAGWMKVQATEEVGHAMKFYGYVFDRNAKVELKMIEGPQTKWDSPLAAFQAALEHEQYITGRINKLVELANQDNDYATRSLLNWYVDEQVEEEASANEIVERLKSVSDNKAGLFILDRELGARKSGGE
jgi:ferritin